MRLPRLLLPLGVLAVSACGESRSPLPLEPEAPAESAVAAGTQLAARQWDGTLYGPDTITQSGTYTYTLCATGLLPLDPIIAEISTSKDGTIYLGTVYPGVECRSAATVVSYLTPDFTVSGVLSHIPDYLPLYKGVTVAIPTPPLGVTIFGDEEVAPDEECGWQASVYGGTPPYSYQWWGGLTGSTETIYGSLGRSSYIWVAVTDATAQADTAQIFVDVDESHSCDW